MLKGSTSLKSHIRSIPDYPKPGIIFRDVTPLLLDATGFRETIRAIIAPFEDQPIDKVLGIEARGFILGGAVADRLGTGFIPARKAAKLPWRTVGREYATEYSTDTIEVHEDAIRPGDKVLLVDDLIATGGTAVAALHLIEEMGGKVVGCTFVVDLPELGGSHQIRELGYPFQTLCAFAGE